MRQSPTLIDTLYRYTFKNDNQFGWDNVEWRKILTQARRFVLDDKMSEFLGDLSSSAFTHKNLAQSVRERMIDNLRVGARLPHATTWIEYNLRKSLTRSHQLLGKPFNPLESPRVEGWLLQQHPSIETAFIVHIVSHDTQIDHGDGCDTWIFPVAMAWTVDNDTVLPWQTLALSKKSMAASEVATGVPGYKSDHAAYVFPKLIKMPNQPKKISNLMSEWAGVLRRIWALLSTINDLPVQVGEVRAAKGFVAKGQYRKFLDHKTLTINVPQKSYTKIIRNALALAHRRGGPVRGHFRKDWRNPPSFLCDHAWIGEEKHMSCSICKGRKIWIVDHIRGDTSVGFVTHDYKVTHEDRV